jgi:hypothetical protein
MRIMQAAIIRGGKRKNYKSVSVINNLVLCITGTDFSLEMRSGCIVFRILQASKTKAEMLLGDVSESKVKIEINVF